MRSERQPFAEPVGPWTFDHWLGAVVIVTIFLGLALNIRPGWQYIRGLFG